MTQTHSDNLKPGDSRSPPPIEVHPVTIPMVNWPILINASQQHIGVSITRKLDEKDLKLRSLGSYLQALYTLESPNEWHLDFAIADSWMLRALSLGFLVISEPLVHSKWMYASKLAGHGNLHFAVYTCDAEEWRQIILRCCTVEVGIEARLIANKIYEYFDQAGLRPMFSKYYKESLRDGTFILCQS
jgi:hypothetical protein